MTEFFRTYPMFTKGAIEAFEMLSTPEERKDAYSHFAVEGVYDEKPDRNCGLPYLATAIFAKPPDPGLPEIKIPDDLKTPHPSVRRGEIDWHGAFWDRLAANIKKMESFRLNWNIRVYLANDMQHLLQELLDWGCEVHVMERSSILHNPGACWRYLAADNTNFFFCRDAEDLCPSHVELPLMKAFMERCEDRSGGYLFRCMWNADQDDVSTVYRPMSGGGMGGYRLELGMEQALAAWHWWGSRGFLPKFHSHPLLNEHRELFGMDWPKYGGDEQFGGQYIYWQQVFNEGRIDSVVGFSHHNLHPLMALDVANVKTANPAAYFCDLDGRPM